MPIGFERHVREGLPQAVHLELDCGHVPQLERPRETHEAMEKFLAEGEVTADDGPRPVPPATAA